MKQLLLLILLVIACSLPALQFARWQTSMGDFTCELYDDIVPITAGNFINLANSGFYDELIFHRVVAGFVIQDGCPLGTGYGGPGYTIQDEFSPLLNHNQAGTLAMARTSAPNSAGSQYYITLAPTPHLNGGYAVFGQVIEGLDTVLGIGTVATNANGLPNTPVTIHNLSIIDLDIGSLTPPNTEALAVNPGEAVMFIVETSSSNGAETFRWFIGEEEQMGENLFIFETSLVQGDASPVRCIVSQGDFSYELAWDFVFPTPNFETTAPALQRQLILSPNPFNGSTAVSFDAKAAGSYIVEIFDMRGRLIQREQNLPSVPGANTWIWKTDSHLAKGNYLIKVTSGEDTFTSKASVF